MAFGAQLEFAMFRTGGKAFIKAKRWKREAIPWSREEFYVWAMRLVSSASTRSESNTCYQEAGDLS